MRRVRRVRANLVVFDGSLSVPAWARRDRQTLAAFLLLKQVQQPWKRKVDHSKSVTVRIKNVKQNNVGGGETANFTENITPGGLSVDEVLRQVLADWYSEVKYSTPDDDVK